MGAIECLSTVIMHPEEVKTMQNRILWPAIACIGLILVLLGSTWALGGYDEMSSASSVTLTLLTLGVIVPIAVGIGFVALIIYGRRSRRDEAVHRATRNDDYD
jgi:hypothetical protein